MTSLPHSAFYRRGRCKKFVPEPSVRDAAPDWNKNRFMQIHFILHFEFWIITTLVHHHSGFYIFIFPGYELFGFISHMGASTMSGHYVCHIKKEGRWVPHNQPLMWWRLENTQSLPLVHIQSLNQVSRTFLLKRRRLLLLLLLFTSLFTRSVIISILKIQLLWMFFIFFSQWLNWNLIY